MKQQDLLSPLNGVTPLHQAADGTVLPGPIVEWLQANHEQLLGALTRAHSALELAMHGEAMLAIEELPEATRQFLWRGMRRHRPALAQLVRDPNVLEMRATFDARLHLRVSDLVQVICAAAPTAGARVRGER